MMKHAPHFKSIYLALSFKIWKVKSACARLIIYLKLYTIYSLIIFITSNPQWHDVTKSPKIPTLCNISTLMNTQCGITSAELSTLFQTHVSDLIRTYVFFLILGPGPGKYLLPSSVGVNSKDLTKSKAPAFSFGSRFWCKYNHLSVTYKLFK